MAQNINIFDFSLSDDDKAELAKMNQHDAGTRDFGDPQFVKYLIETYGSYPHTMKEMVFPNRGYHLFLFVSTKT